MFQQALTSSHIDNLELRIKKEQEPLKKELRPGILAALRPVVDNCFMMPKAKKENFITREKITVDLLRIFQEQKQFKSSENIYKNTQYLACYDKQTHNIGRIVSINLMDQTITFFTYNDMVNKAEPRTKPFSDIDLFDYNSVQFAVMHDQYRRNNEYGLSYVNLYNFLSSKQPAVERKITFDKSYGVEMAKAEENPVMQQIIKEYGIPEEEIKKSKPKIYMLAPDSMVIVAEYDSVKEASEKLGISASTISNVLCQGKSAMKYLEAGGHRWQKAGEPNIKYDTVARYAEPATTGNYNLHLNAE